MAVPGKQTENLLQHGKKPPVVRGRDVEGNGSSREREREKDDYTS